MRSADDISAFEDQAKSLLQRGARIRRCGITTPAGYIYGNECSGEHGNNRRVGLPRHVSGERHCKRHGWVHMAATYRTDGISQARDDKAKRERVVDWLYGIAGCGSCVDSTDAKEHQQRLFVTRTADVTRKKHIFDEQSTEAFGELAIEGTAFRSYAGQRGTAHVHSDLQRAE